MIRRVKILPRNTEYSCFLGILVGALLLIIPSVSHAATYNDGDACGGVGEPPAGSFYRENTVDGYHFLVCDGTTWNISQIIDFTLSGTSIGNNALDSLTTGTDMVAIGDGAGRAQSGGFSGTFIGRNAGSNVNSSGPVIIGSGAGANAGGQYQVIIGGNNAGANAGSNDVIVGDQAGRFSGGSNVALGPYAFNYPSGSNNVAIGYAAGRGVSGGSTAQNSVFIGYGSATAITTGNNNIFLGYAVGNLTTTGSDNIIIGFDLDPSSSTASNELNIGDTIYGDLANNYVGIANATPNVALDVTGSIEFTGTMTDVSDERLKTNIKPITNALLGLDQLKGVSFVMKDDPKRNVELGLIAQDVQKSFPELVKKSSDGVLSLNYQGMVGPMVEMVKELDNGSAALEKEFNDIDARISVLDGQTSISFQRKKIPQEIKYNE